MKFCDTHWSRLRAVVKEKGMWKLVNENAQSLTRHITAEMDGEPVDFDPLWSCTMMIYGNALEIGGAYLMNIKEDGTEHCPLCELNDNVKDPEMAAPYATPCESWIQSATEAAREHCHENKLLPRLQ